MDDDVDRIKTMAPRLLAGPNGATRSVETELLRQRALRMVELANRLERRWSAINTPKLGARPMLKLVH